MVNPLDEHNEFQAVGHPDQIILIITCYVITKKVLYKF